MSNYTYNNSYKLVMPSITIVVHQCHMSNNVRHRSGVTSHFLHLREKRHHMYWSRPLVGKKEMVVSCCAVGCRNRHGERKDLGFYRIPMIPERRKKCWIAAIKRKNWNPAKHLRICGDHFVTGE